MFSSSLERQAWTIWLFVERADPSFCIMYSILCLHEICTMCNYVSRRSQCNHHFLNPTSGSTARVPWKDHKIERSLNHSNLTYKVPNNSYYNYLQASMYLKWSQRMQIIVIWNLYHSEYNNLKMEAVRVNKFQIKASQNRKVKTKLIQN